MIVNEIIFLIFVMREYLLLRNYASYALGATDRFPTNGGAGGTTYRPYWAGGNYHYIEVLQMFCKRILIKIIIV